MLYMILGDDAPDALDRRREVRPAHLEYLRTLIGQNRLLLAGPRPRADGNDAGEAGFYGSLIIAEFDSLDEARAWADQDPYMRAGVFANVIVQPFRKVLP